MSFESTSYDPELLDDDDAFPIPKIWVVEKSSGLPLLSLMVFPDESVIVKYGWPFSTSIDWMVPVTVELFESLELVPVETVATLPMSEAACMTPKLLWNDWKSFESCS